jgi:hypothetical protein
MLHLGGTNLAVNGAGALAAALLMHCPKLFWLTFPASHMDNGARLAIKAFFLGAGAVAVGFNK